MEEAAEVESLNVAETIKRFGVEDFVNTKTENKYIKLIRTGFRSGVNGLISGTASEFFSQLFTIILLWCGSYFVLKNFITTGELLSFYTLIGYFMSPVRGLINMNKAAQDALIAADRLFEIMDLEQEAGEQNENQIGKSRRYRIRQDFFSLRHQKTNLRRLQPDIRARANHRNSRRKRLWQNDNNVAFTKYVPFTIG